MYLFLRYQDMTDCMHFLSHSFPTLSSSAAWHFSKQRWGLPFAQRLSRWYGGGRETSNNCCLKTNLLLKTVSFPVPGCPCAAMKRVGVEAPAWDNPEQLILEVAPLCGSWTRRELVRAGSGRGGGGESCRLFLRQTIAEHSWCPPPRFPPPAPPGPF